MPDDLNDVDTDTDDVESESESNPMRQLRQTYKDEKRARKQAETQLAIYQAGLPNATKERVELFSEAYKGGLEPDQITEAWTKIFGGSDASASTSQGGGPDAPTTELWSPESSSTTERDRLASGVSPGTEGTDFVSDPHSVALGLGEKAMSEGSSRNDATAIALNAIVQQAHSGNPAVLLNKEGNRGQ